MKNYTVNKFYISLPYLPVLTKFIALCVLFLYNKLFNLTYLGQFLKCTRFIRQIFILLCNVR